MQSFKALSLTETFKHSTLSTEARTAVEKLVIGPQIVSPETLGNLLDGGTFSSCKEDTFMVQSPLCAPSQARLEQHDLAVRTLFAAAHGRKVYADGMATPEAYSDLLAQQDSRDTRSAALATAALIVHSRAVAKFGS